MALRVSTPAATSQRAQRPLWLTILAIFALVLGVITTIPQFYYVLFAISPLRFPIGPNTNPLGEVWYWYILSGDNTYRHVDPGVLAGAIEDAFLLGPLYLATGIGLWLRRAWVIPVGLINGAMILYAIIGFFLSDIFAGLPTVTNGISYWATNLPYLIFSLWLLPTLLFGRSLFSPTSAARDSMASAAASSEGERHVAE